MKWIHSGSSFACKSYCQKFQWGSKINKVHTVLLQSTDMRHEHNGSSSLLSCGNGFLIVLGLQWRSVFQTTLGLSEHCLWSSTPAFGNIFFSGASSIRFIFFMNEPQHHCSKLQKIIVYKQYLFINSFSFLMKFHKYSFWRVQFARTHGSRNEFREQQHIALCLSSLGSPVFTKHCYL